MDIVDVHERLLFLADKERGSFFTSAEIDNALDTAQIRELRKYFGDEAAILQQNNRLQYKQQQFVDDAIAQFKVNTPLTIAVPPTGVTSDETIPNDQLFVIGFNYDPVSGTRGGSIDIGSEVELRNRIHSAIYSSRPYAALTSNTTIQVFVPFAMSATLTTIRRPVKPFLDDTLPVDLEWNDSKTIDIIYQALSVLGINAMDDRSIQMSSAKSNQIS